MNGGLKRPELLAATTTAFRERDPHGRVQYHPAWHDLDAPGRAAAFEATCALRAMEAAFDDDGLSTTGRAVLDRIRG